MLDFPASVEPRFYTPFLTSQSRSAPQDGNWSQIKKSGQIKMTPMSAAQSKTENFLGSVTKHMSTYDVGQDGTTKAKVNGSCKKCITPRVARAFSQADVDVTQQGDLSYWKEQYPDVPHSRVGFEMDDSSIERAKSSCFQELFQAYNLGEEIYELRDSLRTLADTIPRAVKVLKKHKPKNLQNRSSEGAIDASDAWLSFRYGLMPIMYSIQDVMKLIQSEGKYRTARRSVKSTPIIDSIPSSGVYFYDTGSVDQTVRFTAKGRWSTPESRILDTININPFTTAAAVYPWALVVRWFFNLNSAIDAYVKSLTTSAQQYVGCMSVKTVRNVTTSLHIEHDSRWRYYFNGNSAGCGDGFYPAFERSGGSLQNFDLTLKRVESETYVRTLISPTDVKIVFDPNLSFTRLVDGLSFLTQRNKRLLRGL
jgi:hypothetical protein